MRSSARFCYARALVGRPLSLEHAVEVGLDLLVGAFTDDLAQMLADDARGGKAEELGKALVGEQAEQLPVVGDRHRGHVVGDEPQLRGIVARCRLCPPSGLAHLAC